MLLTTALRTCRFISSTTKQQSIVAPTSLFGDRMSPISLYKSPSDVSVNNSYEDDLQMRLIGQKLYSKIKSIDLNSCEPDDLDPFYVCDLGEVKKLVKLWNSKLPRIEPFYAVKCNNNPGILQTMVEMGLGFDCASKNEIKLMLEMGVDPAHIIYANPCKAIPYLRYANENQVNKTTVDNIDELHKVAKYHPNCEVLIRLQTDDSSSTCPLSVKFGASLEESKALVAECKKLNLNLTGVAFHVGSGCNDFKTIELAVRDSRALFDYSHSMGFELKMLDVGGGFSKNTFEHSSKILRREIDAFFPETEYPQLKIISELGRFLASSCFTLAVNITSKRADHLKERLYVNDGVYGNLNCILFDHQNVEPKVLTSNGDFKFYDNYYFKEQELANSPKNYSVWGPTCDGLDCISAKCKLSDEVYIGDWLYFKNIGAYTSAASTNFNGFDSQSACLYVDSSVDMP